MNKLLSANFSRMIKNRVFWLGVGAMVLLAVAVPLNHYREFLATGYQVSMDGNFFGYAVVIGILASVFGSLFLGTEYSDGTIRNKLMVGHSRVHIYLANLIICIEAAFLMIAAFLLIISLVGIPLLGGLTLGLRAVVILILSSLLMTIAYCALFTMAGMLISNRAIAAVVCILGAFFLLILGLWINSRLDEPETYGAYMFQDADGTIISEDEYPNPYYLTGAKRQLYEFLYDFIPAGQGLQIMQAEVAHPCQIMLYSLIIVMAATGIGIYFFGRKDIK